jgi:hypothetical protein
MHLSLILSSSKDDTIPDTKGHAKQLLYLFDQRQESGRALA